MVNHFLKTTRSANSRRCLAAAVALGLAATLACSAAGPPPAGTIGLQWGKATDDSVVGYRIYYGRASGRYDRHVDVGPETSHELTGLEPCTEYFVAIKARNAAGEESPGFSEEIRGWPRPAVASVTPPHAAPGEAVTLTIVGENFRAGATIALSAEAGEARSVRVPSCRELVAEVTISPSAPTGPHDVEVVNKDGTFGVGAGLLTIAPR